MTIQLLSWGGAGPVALDGCSNIPGEGSLIPAHPSYSPTPERILPENERERLQGKLLTCSDKRLALETSAIVSLTASITLINTQLIHPFVFRRADAVI